MFQLFLEYVFVLFKMKIIVRKIYFYDDRKLNTKYIAMQVKFYGTDKFDHATLSGRGYCCNKTAKAYPENDA